MCAPAPARSRQCSAVDRGDGAVVDELASVLLAVRRGAAEPAAFRHAADVTAGPRGTFKLFAGAPNAG